MPPSRRQRYRPTAKEVGKKIRDAISALENGEYLIVDESQNPRAFESLGVSTMQDVLEHVLEFLDEILRLGPEKCYCGIGGRVEFCNKKGFGDVRLYAYVWDSPSMTKRMYLKFGVRNRGETPIFSYMHLSCHDDES